MFNAFKSARDGNDEESSISDIVSAAKANLLECNKRVCESESSDPLKKYLEKN